jgi:DNA-binding CsgD family transcriptional regulator
MRLTPEEKAIIRWMRLTPEEQTIIDWIERGNGRPLTPQEIYCSLEQARFMGELSELETGQSL